MSHPGTWVGTGGGGGEWTTGARGMLMQDAVDGQEQTDGQGRHGGGGGVKVQIEIAIVEQTGSFVSLASSRSH